MKIQSLRDKSTYRSNNINILTIKFNGKTSINLYGIEFKYIGNNPSKKEFIKGNVWASLSDSEKAEYGIDLAEILIHAQDIDINIDLDSMFYENENKNL